MSRKQKWPQVLLLLAIVALVVALVYFIVVRMMPGFLDALQTGDEGAIEAYLSETAGIKGMVCVGLLQFLQVVSVALPGMPVQIAAGIVYGTVKGFLLCHLSYLAANIAVFCAARHLGNRVNALVPVDKKSGKLDFIKNSSSPGYMTALACLIPVLPNGIVPYVACQTKLTVKGFAMAVWCGSLMPVLVMCAIGNRIIAGDFLLAVAIFAASLIAVILLTIFRNQVIGLGKTLSERWIRPKVKAEKVGD